MNKHAKFSASAAHRWLACPGSIQLSEKAPPQRESEYASEGTEAHAVVETLLKGGTIDGSNYSFEMLSHASKAVAEIEKMKPEGATLLSETKCSLDFIHEDMGGTTDCAIVEYYGKLIVIDYKYGVMPVDPKENPQMIAYALALAHKYDYEFTSVELVIIQPRSLDVEETGIVKKWMTDVETLKTWAVKFKQAAHFSTFDHPKFQAGDHCKYCPAAPICPELKNKSLKELQAEFCEETGATTVPVMSSIKNLGAALTACDRLETWIGKLREHAFHVLESGGQVPGYKLVQKRAIRKWADPEIAFIEGRRLFGQRALTKPELLSPAQLEKLDGTKEFIAEHAIAKSGGLTIAPESDSREPYNYFEAEFKSLERKEEKKECEKPAKSAATSMSKTRSCSDRSATSAKRISKTKAKKPTKSITYTKH